MARNNFGFEKRQRELNKEKKKEEKRQRKLERKDAGDELPGGAPEALGGDPQDEGHARE